MGYEVMSMVVGDISWDGNGVSTVVMDCFHLFKNGFIYRDLPLGNTLNVV